MTITYNNVEYDVITACRRYGRQFYTWVNYFKDPNGVCYGAKEVCGFDPFPCVRPKNSELVELLQMWMTDGAKWIFEKCERVFID